jgi:hypothetical protein
MNRSRSDCFAVAKVPLATGSAGSLVVTEAILMGQFSMQEERKMSKSKSLIRQSGSTVGNSCLICTFHPQRCSECGACWVSACHGPGHLYHNGGAFASGLHAKVCQGAQSSKW